MFMCVHGEPGSTAVLKCHLFSVVRKKLMGPHYCMLLIHVAKKEYQVVMICSKAKDTLYIFITYLALQHDKIPSPVQNRKTDIYKAIQTYFTYS